MITALKLESLDMPDWPDSCSSCAHFLGLQSSGHGACAAFPDRIPDAVLSGRHLHHKPIEGDHGIQWALHPQWGSATAKSIAAFDAALASGEIPTT